MQQIKKVRFVNHGLSLAFAKESLVQRHKARDCKEEERCSNAQFYFLLTCHRKKATCKVLLLLPHCLKDTALVIL